MSQHWYVIHVHSGSENKVAEAIREQIAKKGLSEKIENVIVPTHQVIEIRRGKKVPTDKKFFPGYVLIKMELNDETWLLVRSIAKVTGFLGNKGKPSPISEAEAKRLLTQVQEGVTTSSDGIHFEVGEQIRVCDGPFTSFNGVVEEVDADKSRLKVTVSIFGRSTPVDLDFSQVEKV